MKVNTDPFQADLYAGQLVLLEATQSRTTSASSIVAILFCLGIATIYTLSGTKPLSHQVSSWSAFHGQFRDSSCKRTSDPITGGLSAVIWTDLAQFVLMVGGAIGLSAVG